MAVEKIPLYYGHQPTGTVAQWADDIADMVRKLVRKEKVFVEFNGNDDARRTGSIAEITMPAEEMQNFFYGCVDPATWTYRKIPARPLVNLTETMIYPSMATKYRPNYIARWDKRPRTFEIRSGWAASWLKGYDETLGTQWVWKRPEVPTVVPQDKLGRDIKVGDFISYILYHFGGNNGNAAGIYYGKVTQIEKDGTVYAKNIKLKDDDISEEKRIKDHSLIVIMTKDLMDKLMLARLSVL